MLFKAALCFQATAGFKGHQIFSQRALPAATLMPRRTPSGATHDAAAMADLCPTAMLFVRCKNGVSHSPEEFACEADMRLAVDALKDLISKISAKLGGDFS